MSPLPVFGFQFAWFLVVWTTIAVVFVGPRLRGVEPDRALAVWVTPQLFRALGLGPLGPSLAPEMPRSFAVPTAIGDTTTAVLALVSLIALTRRAPYARP